MKLSLKNIGKIHEAMIEINGITVIAGENNTGKSTVSKALYSVFNSFYHIDLKIHRERENSVRKLLELIRSDFDYEFDHFFMEMKKAAQDFVSDIESYRDNPEKIKTRIAAMLKLQGEMQSDALEDRDIGSIVQRINEVLRVPHKDILRSVLEKQLNMEFNNQINNIFHEDPGEIKLQIKNKDITIPIEENRVTGVMPNVELRTEAIYLDDPFVLDVQKVRYGVFRNVSSYPDHRDHLKNKLFFNKRKANIVDEIVVNNKFEKIYRKIHSVCSGDMVRDRPSDWGYKKAGSDQVLDLRNLSTGLKTFVILKTLLTNGAIEQNGTIILDEPEIHLHPEWQLLFAELIVLIQKEFGMHILLNTHSPYFLNAIEVYAAKYGIADKCKYYLASLEGEISRIEDVTGNIEAIYSRLAKPLQKLENERYSSDED